MNSNLKDLMPDEKIAELNAMDFSRHFCTKVIETTEEFMFATISDFCNDVTQRIVKKKDLEEALVKHFPKSRIYNKGHFECPSCFMPVYGEQKYCDNCGQHLEKMEVVD